MAKTILLYFWEKYDKNYTFGKSMAKTILLYFWEKYGKNYFFII
jgi:uncharacterized membrane protein